MISPRQTIKKERIDNPVSTSLEDLIEVLDGESGDNFMSGLNSGEIARYEYSASPKRLPGETAIPVNQPRPNENRFKIEDDFFDELDQFQETIAALSISPTKVQHTPTSMLRPAKAASPVIAGRKKLPVPPSLKPVRKHTSKFRGVHFHRKSGKFRAQIQLKGKRVSIGSYATDVLAAQAYDNKAREHLGSRAKLNFPISLNEGKSAAVSLSSGFRGVCLTKRDHKWLAQVSFSGNVTKK